MHLYMLLVKHVYVKQLKNAKCFEWGLKIVSSECVCDLCVCVYVCCGVLYATEQQQ
jgi:hypothetical protein